jgi:hypothetical protein
MTHRASGLKEASPSSRSTEIGAEHIAGNRNLFVHTADAFDPTAQQAARYEAA